MSVSPTKLTIMPFPQEWDGSHLRLNILVLPHEDPLAPFAVNIPSGVTAPSFATATLKLRAMVIDSLDLMPKAADVTHNLALTTTAPANAVTLFKELAKAFKITKPSNVPNIATANTYIQKYLPKSYRNSFAFSQPRTRYAKTDDSYHCEMKKRRDGLPKPIYSTDEVSWGKVFAFALRQPVLATELGFIYHVSLSVPTGVLKDGGWIYVDLDSTSDFHQQVVASPDIIKRYSARIPALSVKRSLFAAVQFPVSDVPLLGNYDPIFIEAEDYDDGFAKIVHSMQPVSANLLLEPGDEGQGLSPTRDFGVRIGWDDEQLLIWQNRQMTIDPDIGQRLDAPMGVLNYRVDVRHHADDDSKWNSLMKVQGDLNLNGIDLGEINAELGIEVGPTQLDGQKQGIFWLPLYYTQWAGTSLALKDAKAAKLAGTEDLIRKQMSPVDDERVLLEYGKSYDFRVRFADTTGGGPNEKNVPVNGGPSPFATTRFRRYLPPQKVAVKEIRPEGQTAPSPPTAYEVSRPFLGYPSLLYTGLANAFNLLVADLPSAMAAKREPGYWDPDVAQIQIDVSVKAPEMDNLASKSGKESYYHLFTTHRSFPADLTQPIGIDLDYQDAPVIKFGDEADLGDLPLTTGSSPLMLPTARDIRIQITAVGKEDNTLAYFGNRVARFSKPVILHARAASQDERSLLINESPAKQFQSLLLQPDPPLTPNLIAAMTVTGSPFETPANLMQRMADQLELDTTGMTLFGKPGTRVLFGCSKRIRHTLAPDHGSITFAAKADLVGQWITVISLDVNRDWSWDAPSHIAFVIKRDGVEEVGQLEWQDIVTATALIGADRSHTHIVFFDAVDPKEFSGPFPEPQKISYTVEPAFIVTPLQQDPVKNLQMTLPVAVPPAQVPKVISAGIALSPYDHTDDYSSTVDRKRVLWIEFAEPVENAEDDYFAFVKAYAPDPILLSGETAVPDPKENIPYMPSELIRVITAGESDDQAGLNTWQRLIPCSEMSPRHFIVPLPPGLNADSNELFGFFVYEFCAGHARVWSTAHGRFGRPIRLTGVQHPAPGLTCMTDRNDDGIFVSAPYATAVYDGQSLLPSPPLTEIWGVLYTQVLQADGKAHRNILLGERKLYGRKREWGQFGLSSEATVYGTCFWSQDEVQALLEALALPPDSPLSVLATELYRNYEPVGQPIGTDLGKMRIYRASRLQPVPFRCCG
ncbi:MAG: hypothetical protein JWM21_1773 [Acidobacteria bacterium]|nr:hypothetical protein [Acidobacteriota bacterium]